MSYTILKISTLYSDYKRQFFKADEHLCGSYKSIYNRLVSDAFAEADFLTRSLRSLGVDSHEVFIDAYPLQKAWAIDNGIRYRSAVYVLTEQIRSICPDVLFVEDVGALSNALLKEIKQNNPGIRLVIGRCGLLTNAFLEKAKLYDVILSATPGYNDKLNELGYSSYLMYHAFESTILDGITYSTCLSDLIFTGTLGFSREKHGDRLSMLNSVYDLGLSLNIMARIGKRDALLLGFVELLSSILGDSISSSLFFEKIPVDLVRQYSILSPMVNRAVYGMAMYDFIASSKICLNNHIGLSGYCAGNMRLFEATGVGSCLLTDYKENLSDLFELDYEVVTYRSNEELCERAKWLIDNESARREIAAAGQKRTLIEHSYQRRASALNDIICNRLKRLP